MTDFQTYYISPLLQWIKITYWLLLLRLDHIQILIITIKNDQNQISVSTVTVDYNLYMDHLRCGQLQKTSMLLSLR